MGSAIISRDWCLFFTFCSVFGIVCACNADLGQLLRIIVPLFIGLGILSYLIYQINKRGFLNRSTKKKVEKTTAGLNESAIQEKQKKARQKLQENYTHQSYSHYENVIKPQKEAKQKAAEEELYRFSGPAWKGRGDKLGTEEELPDDGGHTGRDAAQRRHLPENVTNPPPVIQAKKKEKKVITLPTEPSIDDPEGITVSLRTPLGRIHRRRFLKSHSMQNLLDFMSLLGYSQKRYCISSSYPRQVISQDVSKTFSDVGLTHDIYLNVEEIEEDESS